MDNVRFLGCFNCKMMQKFSTYNILMHAGQKLFCQNVSSLFIIISVQTKTVSVDGHVITGAFHMTFRAAHDSLGREVYEGYLFSGLQIFRRMGLYMFSQRTWICVSFGAARNLTSIRFLQNEKKQQVTMLYILKWQYCKYHS